MALTVKSKRDLAMESTVTPDTLGPGAYLGVASTRHDPHHVPFASSKQRDLNRNSSTSAITPGPGAYTKLPDPEVDLSPRLHSGFATTAPRTAPIAPRSSAYKEWEGVKNPGPGQYESPSVFANAMKGTSHQIGAHTNPRTVVKAAGPQVPSIPSKGKNYGYVLGVSRNDLVPQKGPPAETLRSGVGNDTVGPGDYTPTLSKGKATSFGRSSSRAASRLDEHTVPGPGSYSTSPKALPVPAVEPTATIGASLSTTSAMMARSLSTSIQRGEPLPSHPMHPIELRKHHGAATIPLNNLPAAGSAGSGGSSPPDGKPSRKPLIPVPDAAHTPANPLEVSMRLVGSKPWSKPDYYFRSVPKQSSVFASRTPGPGAVFKADDAPGSRASSVPVVLKDLNHPDGPDGFAEDARPVGVASGLFSPAMGVLPAPGPASYNLEDSARIRNELELQESFNFGTFSSRSTGWDRRSLATPYTDASSSFTPGPGSYARADTAAGTISTTDGKPVATKIAPSPNLPPSFVPSAAPGFKQSASRPCLTKDDEYAPRGPGEYDSHKATALAPNTRGSLLGSSSFSDTSKRSSLARKPSTSDDSALSHVRSSDSGNAHQTQHHVPMSRKGHSAFASGVERKFPLASAAPPSVAPGRYETLSNWGSRSMPLMRRHRYAVNSNRLEAIAAARGVYPVAQPFSVSDKRFKTSRMHGVDATPGPGYYADRKPRTAIPGRRGGFSQEPRFQADRKDYLCRKKAVKAGPGDYELASTMLKRSFNVTYAAGGAK